MDDPTRRFSSRVENYIRYRPGYPPGVLEALREDCGLAKGSLIADIGSGTGILTELFLRNGNRVLAVEPNREMREAAERLLGGHPGFESISGRAEATTLPKSSVDFVTAGQAFHWFEREKARKEFARILKPGGWVMLVWNDRQTASTPFLAAYEQLLQTYGTDYRGVVHKQTEDLSALGKFFEPAGFTERIFNNRQDFDLEGLKGRLFSSSYAPEPGHPHAEAMLVELEQIFQGYQADGKVTFEYKTVMYYGQLK
jgi:ubiquinone/menaquinone biosynthesis C-methylase UbiE